MNIHMVEGDIEAGRVGEESAYVIVFIPKYTFLIWPNSDGGDPPKTILCTEFRRAEGPSPRMCGTLNLTEPA